MDCSQYLWVEQDVDKKKHLTLNFVRFATNSRQNAPSSCGNPPQVPAIASVFPPKLARRAAAQHDIFRSIMKPSRRSPTTRSTGTKEFLFLFGAAWVCAGALVKWE